MTAEVQHRRTCPACESAACSGDPIVLPFAVPPLSEYLDQFYTGAARDCVRRLAGARVVLATCAGCGTTYHQEVPSEAFLHDFYSALSSSHEQPGARVDPYRQEQRARELAMVIRYLGVDVPRVLDFGTGNGTWARLAAAMGCRSHASDTASDGFASLEQAGVTCHRPDALPAAAFDFIHTEQVFEHLAQPGSVLRHLKSALRKGGVLSIGVPDDPQLQRKLRQPDWLAGKSSPASLNAVAPIEHLNAFSAAGLTRLGARVGLERLAIVGWDLMTTDAAARLPLRTRAGLLLRRRLRDVFTSPYRLAQTAFFRLPG